MSERFARLSFQASQFREGVLQYRRRVGVQLAHGPPNAVNDTRRLCSRFYGGLMPHAFHDADRDVFSIGVVLPHRGAAGIHYASCRAAAVLAASELNEHGGAGDREVRLRFFDGAEAAGPYLAEVGDAVEAGEIDAVTGSHPSFVKDALCGLLGSCLPYVFPSVWEGSPVREGLFATGETPWEQCLPALEWFRINARVKRWAVVGDVFVWPRKTAAYLESHLKREDQWAGTRLVSYDDILHINLLHIVVTRVCGRGHETAPKQ